MKKIRNCFGDRHLSHITLKIVKVMKLTISLLLIAAFSAMAGESYSQSKKLTIGVKDATVEEILSKIEEQSEFYFFYSEKIVDVKRRMSLDITDQKVEDILSELFAGTNVTYSIKDRIIVLSSPEIIEADARALFQQTVVLSGKVTDKRGIPLTGVTAVVKGTTLGTTTDANGNFSISVPPNSRILVFSFIGMVTQEVIIGNQTVFNITMEETLLEVEEVVVVGYGTQKKSDITGSIASISRDKLEILPNLNIAQTIQGAIPGVIVQQAQSGAGAGAVIMIRGRNSILASNDPLIVVDGISYYGSISDININDVQSIEVLKDASAAAIYGSRGANGVILITTKAGAVGKAKIEYEGKVGFQEFINVPDYMNDGPRFYQFKETREGPGKFTASELAVYQSGKWTNWPELALRNGFSHQHNISVSGGTENTQYFIGGSYLDVQGLAINDDYRRLTNRLNIDTRINSWLMVGTRTQISNDDRSGVAPSFSAIYQYNPLTTAYDDNGNLTIYSWPEYLDRPNPMSPVLYDDTDKSYQIISNNYAMADLPFIPGMSYRLNAGLRRNTIDMSTYRKRNTSVGLASGGSASIDRILGYNMAIENILSYKNVFGKHSVFLTGVYSYEENSMSSNALTASRFPNDFITYYAVAQAENILPNFSYEHDALISQMLRINYDFDESRYLLTLTGRRDGFSGFGSEKKWGIFPSAALGWNLVREGFFPLKDLFDQFKLRVSMGTNGNQAVGAYESITRMREENMVSGSTTLAGYVPSVLGDRELGWETSKSLNFGLDFRIQDGRVSGDINYFITNTYDLLLNRTISLVHGISSITQNIGETRNRGLEFSLESRNIVKPDFSWTSSANLSLFTNEIVALYGLLDAEGKEIDDVGNKWFIGKPIRVNYDYKFIGVWQLNEETEAAKWGSKPGYAKLHDVNEDGFITAEEDRQILGQQDPKLIWGLNNSISYKNFRLAVFVHGVHGVTKFNAMLQDASVGAETRGTTIAKNWWTPDNPTNEYYKNEVGAQLMGGGSANFYQNASFLRIKDVSLSYDFPASLLEKTGIGKLRLFATGKNLGTITSWKDGDPELDQGRGAIPLQREIVFGLNLGF